MDKISFVKKQYISYIDRIIEHHKISHSYLIEIDDYEKDYNYIIAFIKMIISNLKYEEICSSNNPVFSLIDTGNYPDITFIYPDGNWIKKSQLLNLQKEYHNKSLLDNKRIYVIMHAECLNPSSANTILKFIEEPEDNIIAFLVTENRYHVIDTILSRCQLLTLKENSFSFSIDDSCKEILQYLINPTDFFIRYNYIYNNILMDKNVTIDILENLEKVIICYINSSFISDFHFDNELKSYFEGVSINNLIFILNIIEEELIRLNYNVNFKLWLDCFFSKLIVGGK